MHFWSTEFPSRRTHQLRLAWSLIPGELLLQWTLWLPRIARDPSHHHSIRTTFGQPMRGRWSCRGRQSYFGFESFENHWAFEARTSCGRKMLYWRHQLHVHPLSRHRYHQTDQLRSKRIRFQEAAFCYLFWCICWFWIANWCLFGSHELSFPKHGQPRQECSCQRTSQSRYTLDS